MDDLSNNYLQVRTLTAGFQVRKNTFKKGIPQAFYFHIALRTCSV